MQIKTERIEQDLDYPCPCCPRGQLCPITLTEALGCQKCQKIFVIQPGGYTLEQLSTHPHLWGWDGQRWRPLHPHWPGRSVVIISLGASACLLFIGLLFASSLNVGSGMLWWILMVIVVIVTCAVVLSLRSRRY
ncbi:MAG: hypothetical protein GFH24_608438n21 [Chloroflexi bacterium AL-N5]|nr:hypothetical protein [Chloroflexi bacterium AL-N5]